MNEYKCSQCNAEVKVIDNKLIRSCNHCAPVIAIMSAITTGSGTTK